MNIEPISNRKVLRSYFERLEEFGTPAPDTPEQLEHQYILALVETYRLNMGETDAKAFRKPLKPSESLHQHIPEVLDIFAKYKLDNPRIMGEVADDEDVELGFMFDPPGDFEFQAMFYAASELEQLLSVKVNMLSSDALNNEHWSEFQIKSVKNSLKAIA